MGTNEYHREYNKQRYHERIALAHKILGGKCIKCNSTEKLQIDHKDPNKKSFEITTITRLSMKRFLKELEKCQLLCKNDHERKTAIEKSVEHGGGISGQRNCPCSLCKAKKKEYMKNYTQRKKLLVRVQ